MGVLISGIIGAVASMAAWIGIESVIEKELGWLAIGVGLVTGFAVHAAAAKPRQQGFGRGALAAILSLAAIGLGPLAQAKIMKSMNKDADKKVGAIEVQVPDAEEGDSDAADSEEPVEPALNRGDVGKLAVGDSKVTIGKPNKESMTDMDMVWLCASALVAYLIGKGSDEVAATEGEEEATNPEAADTEASEPQEV